MNWFLLVFFGIISGLGDSQGFFYASKVWQNNTFHLDALIKSYLGFAFGIGVYIFMIRIMNNLNIHSAEIQTIFWFCATLIILAVLNGEFLRWKFVDQSVAVAVVIGLCWLLVRVGK